MRLVVDATVAVKWVFPDPNVEPEADRAVAILRGIQTGHIEVAQPAHWLLETTAVVARLRPAVIEQAIGLLDALELPVYDDVDVLRRAARLAVDLNHHLLTPSITRSRSSGTPFW